MRIQRDKQTYLGFPIVGKLKVGYTHPEKGYPISTDYFIPRGTYAKLFTDVYGEKPNVIKILFHSDDINTVCRERYEIRDDSGKLISESDGQLFKTWDKKLEKYVETRHDNPSEYMQKVAERLKKEWSEVLTINFMIPAVKGIGGLWSLTTKCKETSLKNIRDSFDAVQAIAGTVVNIPFDLAVVKHKSQSPSGRAYSVVSLTSNLSNESMLEVSRLLSDTTNVVRLLKEGQLTEEKIKQLKSGL